MNEYTFEELEIGHTESFEFEITNDNMAKFREITGDFNPLHTDEKYAKENGFDSVVVYGMLTASFLSTLAGMYTPGKRSLIHTVKSDMIKPVYIGQRLICEGIVVEKGETFKTLKVNYTIKTVQDGNKVVRGSMMVGVLENER